MSAPARQPLHLYRALLRELPPISLRRTPLHAILRSNFQDPDAAPDAAEQLVVYLRAQRNYVTLLERYNLGLTVDLDGGDHVRRTARRVGLDVDSIDRGKKGGGGGGGEGKE